MAIVRGLYLGALHCYSNFPDRHPQQANVSKNNSRHFQAPEMPNFFLMLGVNGDVKNTTTLPLFRELGQEYLTWKSVSDIRMQTVHVTEPMCCLYKLQPWIYPLFAPKSLNSEKHKNWLRNHQASLPSGLARTSGTRVPLLRFWVWSFLDLIFHCYHAYGDKKKTQICTEWKCYAARAPRDQHEYWEWVENESGEKGVEQYPVWRAGMNMMKNAIGWTARKCLWREKWIRVLSNTSLNRSGALVIIVKGLGVK
jgi:hypothetical protein